MTPARARKFKAKSAHLKLVVDNPHKEPSNMPMILFFSLPFILATSMYDGWMDALLGPVPESIP